MQLRVRARVWRCSRGVTPVGPVPRRLGGLVPRGGEVEKRQERDALRRRLRALEAQRDQVEVGALVQRWRDACAAARAVLQVMDEEDILGNCSKIGAQIKTRVGKLVEEMPQVFKELRGSGCFQGLEVAGGEDSQKHAYEMHKRIKDYGVILGRGSAQGNVFRLQPPMVIQPHDIDLVADTLEEALCPADLED